MSVNQVLYHFKVLVFIFPNKQIVSQSQIRLRSKYRIEPFEYIGVKNFRKHQAKGLRGLCTNSSVGIVSINKLPIYILPNRRVEVRLQQGANHKSGKDQNNFSRNSDSWNEYQHYGGLLPSVSIASLQYTNCDFTLSICINLGCNLPMS